jgi:competence protein ComEA
MILLRREPPPIVLHPPPTPAPTATLPPTATPGPVTVYVSGAVHQPGLYTLPDGARVGDAVNAAGGFADEANPAAVNLAQRLGDGAQVHIPTAAEQAPPPVAGLSGVLPTPTPTVATAASSVRININSATAAELETLPGIGPARAADIIANRPYTSIDDLDRVPGIGAATIANLRELITVE